MARVVIHWVFTSTINSTTAPLHLADPTRRESGLRFAFLEAGPLPLNGCRCLTLCERATSSRYLQMCSQIGTGCGQLHLVKQAAAASNRTGALYYTVVAAGPSNPQELGVADWDGYLSRYAYHEMEVIWAMETWDWFGGWQPAVST